MEKQRHPCQQPQSTVIPATETANSTATSGEKSTNNNKPEGNISLTIQYFSDIEEQNSNGKRNAMFEERFIVGSDSADDDEESIEDEDEEINDYAGVDEEVVSGLLGLTDINT
jgi:hypothetical protein